MNINDVISIKEAAELLGVHRPAIYYAIGKGHLTAVTISGRKYVVLKSLEGYKPRADAGRPRKSLPDKEG